MYTNTELLSILCQKFLPIVKYIRNIIVYSLVQITIALYDNLSLRNESCAIINVRGVSTKLNLYHSIANGQ